MGGPVRSGVAIRNSGQGDWNARSACGAVIPVADGMILTWRSRARVTPGVCGLPSWESADGKVGCRHIRHIRIVATRCVYLLDMRMRNCGRVEAAGSRRGLGRRRAPATPRCSRARRARHGCVRPSPSHGFWGIHRFAAKRLPLGDRGHQASTLGQRATRVLRSVWSKGPFHGTRSV